MDEDNAYFYIVNKKKQEFTVIIDKDELSRLINLDYRWHVKWDNKAKSYYIKTTYYYHDEKGKTKSKPIHLHSLIAGAEPRQTTDHINHNTLDNRKINLRVLSKDDNNLHRKGANCTNKSTGVRNVSYIERDNQYWVQLCVNYEHFIWKFEFNEFEKACEFAKNKRLELYGEIGA